MNLVSIGGRLTAPNLSCYCMSKHAAVSFSDALRRETHRHGIKVSTIEPTTYKTPMFNKEALRNTINEVWEQSSDEVKQFYGKEYLEDLKERKEDSLSLVKTGEDINEVIDAIAEALRSVDPKIRYKPIPGGCLNKVFVTIVENMPTALVDKLIYYTERNSVQPAYLNQDHI